MRMLPIVDNAESPVGPKAGTSERYILQSKLSYVSSEVHGTVGGLFQPNLSEETLTYLREKYALKLKFLNDVELADGRKFWVGDSFTVVDAYLYIVLGWSGYLKIDLTPYPAVKNYFDGIAALEHVKEAHAAMSGSMNDGRSQTCTRNPFRHVLGLFRQDRANTH
ncbi:glutathione S-transferase [Obelidium mucronatum]|nr:glutathione S-transferase [Obelidium mucronatum]